VEICSRITENDVSIPEPVQDYSNRKKTPAETDDVFTGFNSRTGSGLLEPVAMANHSFGKRDFRLREGAKTAFVPWDESGCTGWTVFSASDATYIMVASASSGSKISARWRISGGWEVELEVPCFIPGDPDTPPPSENYALADIGGGFVEYRGIYYRIFHEALRTVVEDSEVCDYCHRPLERDGTIERSCANRLGHFCPDCNEEIGTWDYSSTYLWLD